MDCNPRRCSIGECLPQGESIEECKARFNRIVAKQKQCYSDPSVGETELLDRCHLLIPLWMNADFLYRINYGPGTDDDVDLAWKSTLQPVLKHKSKRLRVTLLDRLIVQKLFKAIFKQSINPPILHSDWDATNEYEEGNRYPSAELISPFDYISHTPETSVYRWCEEFVVQYLWRPDYSSAIFGNDVRPPMAAVAYDVILMATYLASLPRHPERLLADCFKKFLSSQKRKLSSISIGPDFNWSWACRGYLWDLFNIIIMDSLSENGLDRYSPKRITDVRDEAEFVKVTWVEHGKFPGGDAIGIGESPVDADHLKELYGSLEDMRASFICSGPFKIDLTTNLSDHLMMKNRKLLIYCDKPSKTRNRGHIPGARYYGPYVEHALGKLLGADTLLTELTYSYSVIFSRDLKSRAIAHTLFAGSEYKLTPVFCTAMDMTTVGRAGKVIILNWESSFKEGRDPMLRTFQQYRGHFALIHQQMTNWKPENRKDLLQPGYRDRFLWYSTIFGAVIASLGVISIITSIISAATGIISMKAALESVKK